MPSTVHVDEDSGVMAWFRDAELFHLPSIWPQLAWSCGEDHEIIQEILMIMIWRRRESTLWVGRPSKSWQRMPTITFPLDTLMAGTKTMMS